MNQSQTFKNQELFSYTFFDKKFDNKYDFQIDLKENYKDEISEMLKEAPDPPNLEKYCDYTLSLSVGKWFFYTAFVFVMPYQKRIDFLEYQFNKSQHKISFLNRIESLSQVDYWYSFGEYSFYNTENEKIVNDWLIEKFENL